MKRRTFLRSLGALTAPQMIVRSRAAAAPPNIVLILADDLSYRDLSIYGQQRFTTPNLDRLAVGGVRFTQGYCGSPECAPSRGTLMTGLHTGHAPIRLNASARGQDHLGATDLTIAEALKQAGYATGMAGKWGIGLPGTPGTPDKKGFDDSFGFYDQSRAHTYFPHYLMENGKQVWLPENFGFDLERLYRNNVPEPSPADLNQYDAAGNVIPKGVKDPLTAKYSHALIERAALRFIREHRQQPFFLYFAPQLPHGPVIVDNLGELKDRGDFPTIKQKEWAAMVQRLDRSVGEIVSLLREQRVLENTLILFASDNGYSMSGYFGRGNENNNWPDDPFLRNKGPFRGGKFSVLEGGLRVPFFAHWQGRFAPAVVSEPVWLVDVFPTLLEACGAHGPKKLDGMSLMPILTGSRREPAPARPLYWERMDAQVVRQGPWYAYRPHPAKQVELYLLEEDLQLERDVAKHYPEVAARLARIMAEQHVDHPWYHNPGETPTQRKAKEERAKALGQRQESVRGNTRYPEGWK